MYLPTSDEKKIAVFPNPTNGRLMIRYLLDENEKGIFQVVDIYGQLITEATLNPYLGAQTIDLKNNPSGVYYYRFFVNGIQKATGKIVLTH